MSKNLGFFIGSHDEQKTTQIEKRFCIDFMIGVRPFKATCTDTTYPCYTTRLFYSWNVVTILTFIAPPL